MTFNWKAFLFIMWVDGGGRCQPYIYWLQWSWAKVIFSQACVKNSVHRGGVWSRVGCLVLEGVWFWGGSGPRGVSLLFSGEGLVQGVSGPRGVWSKGGSGPQGVLFFGGSNFFEGVSNFSGVLPNFWGGLILGFSNFSGSPNFWGVSKFLGGRLIQIFLIQIF